MKKFLIAVILVIPMLVVIAILASSAIIVASGTPVNPDRMTVFDEENKDLPDVISMDYYSGGTFLNIEVFPGIAGDKSVTFKKVSGSGDGEVEFTPVSENRYKIMPTAIGVAQYTIRPTSNISIYTTITIDVTSDSAIGNSIYNDFGDELDNKYEIYGEERLYAETYPMSSLDSVEWASSNTSVFYVDKNGVIYPTGRGLANLYVTINDKSGNSIVKNIQISTKYAVATSKVAYFGVEPDEDEILGKVALEPSETSIEKLSDNLYRLSSDIGSESYSAEVEIRTVTADFAFLDNVEEVYIGNAPAYLTVGMSGSRFTPFDVVNYSVDDVGILRVLENGKIVPLSVGNTIVHAEYDGTVTSKAITVKVRPSFIELSLSAADGERGIEMSRVWAPFNMADGQITEGVDLAIKNQNASYDVEWSFDGLGDLSVNENGKGVHLTFAEEEAGKTVTVTAMLKMGTRYIKSVKNSFAFKVTENYQSINVTDFEGYKKVNENSFAQMDIVLQDDIYFDSLIYTKASLYGNGFIVDGSMIDYKDVGDCLVYYYSKYMRYEEGKPNEVRYLLCKEYTVQNVHIRCNGVDNFSMGSLALGCGLKFENLGVPTIARYCEIEYCNVGLESYLSQNVTIEGCLFGDNYRFAVDIQCITRSHAIVGEYPYEVNVKNVVFKKANGPAMLFNATSIESYEENYLPDVHIDGFIDCYNWKEQSAIADMIANIISSTGAASSVDLGSVIDLLRPTINNIVEESTMREMLYSYKGKKYICPCIFVAGLLYTVDFSTVQNDSNLAEMPFKMENKNGEELPIVKSANLILSKLIKNVKTLSNPSMMYTANFKDSTPAVLPDSAVPNSEELFRHLKGEI